MVDLLRSWVFRKGKFFKGLREEGSEIFEGVSFEDSVSERVN